MKLLASNISPLRTNHKTFYEEFYEMSGKSNLLKICTGFVTSDSLAEITQLIKVNRRPNLKLVIGMHQFAGFQKAQYEAARNLNSFLVQERMGEVRVATQFPYHGKLYEFFNNNSAFSAIIGSSNLSSIVQSTNRVYESNLLVDDPALLTDVDTFIEGLFSICQPVDGISPVIVQSPPPLDDVEGVIAGKIGEYQQLLATATGPRFVIPLKADPSLHGKSNLNAYFGKGRLNTRTGIEIPRPWYEVELIVSNEITSKPGYPRQEENDGIISIITDDGWKFKCKVSGDYSKNFRSEGSLSILGRWIKGRLESAGVLTPGDPVTNDMLKKYGKTDLDLIYTGIADIWLLNFNPANS